MTRKSLGYKNNRKSFFCNRRTETGLYNAILWFSHLNSHSNVRNYLIFRFPKNSLTMFIHALKTGKKKIYIWINWSPKSKIAQPFAHVLSSDTEFGLFCVGIWMVVGFTASASSAWVWGVFLKWAWCDWCRHTWQILLGGRTLLKVNSVLATRLATSNGRRKKPARVCSFVRGFNSQEMDYMNFLNCFVTITRFIMNS